MGIASSTEIMDGEGVLGGALIPEPPQQPRQGLGQGLVWVAPPAPPHTVLLQALGQKHLPCAQRAAPA